MHAHLHRAARFVAGVAQRFSAADGTLHCGNFAYLAMLALFPFLIFASALTGFVIGPEGAQEALQLLFEPFPPHVAQTLEPVVESVIGERRSGVLTFSAIAALWAASNGMDAVRMGFDDAYGVARQRQYALNRLYLLVLVIIAVAGFMVLAALIIFAPLVFHLLESALGIAMDAEVELMRYGAAAALLIVLLWLMHRLLPSRPMAGMVLWPGILLSTVLWAAGATGMSIYLAYAPSYSLTYGTLAGVILTLLFFYLTGAALLIGAHLNAAINESHETAAKGRTVTDA